MKLNFSNMNAILTALLLAPLAAFAAPSADSNSQIVIVSEAGAKLDCSVTKDSGPDEPRFNHSNFKP